MSAAEIRQAAETLRGMALTVPQGYWWAGLAKLPTDSEGDWVVDSADRLIAGNIGIESDRDAEQIASYIAAMSPDIGLALAKWLEDIAAGWMWDGEEPGVVDWEGDRLTLEESMDMHAVKIARLINGGSNE